MFTNKFNLTGLAGYLGSVMTIWDGWTLADVSILIGIVTALLSSIANLVFMAAYPLWSLIMITLNVVVIYAVTAHGDRRSLDGY